MRSHRISKPFQAANRRVPAPHPSWVYRNKETAERARALTVPEFWAGLGI